MAILSTVFQRKMAEWNDHILVDSFCPYGEAFSEGIIVATKMWMIRGDGGKLYDDFRDKQVVAIGWSGNPPEKPVHE